MRELPLGMKRLEDGEEWRTPWADSSRWWRQRCLGHHGEVGERMREGEEEGRSRCFWLARGVTPTHLARLVVPVASAWPTANVVVSDWAIWSCRLLGAMAPRGATSAGRTTLECHCVNESRQCVQRDPVHNHANMFGVTKRARTGNKNFVRSFLK
jgi:hypothetical protein